ncbi:MAG: hypothetical protein HYX35_00090 [Proteobacteria bacterium]|nr:hypothetical protein [Pseudomonadota bacterium]
MLADSAKAINVELQKAVHKSNSYRPHANLNMLTPLAYIQSSIQRPPESHFICYTVYMPSA